MFNLVREQSSSVRYFKPYLKTGFKADLKTDDAINCQARGTALNRARVTPCAFESSDFFAAYQLARSLHDKVAFADINYSDSKTVIFTPSSHFNRHAFFAGLGSDINDVDGCYITAFNSDRQPRPMADTVKQQLFSCSIAAGDHPRIIEL